jgi:hypothetical protein
MAALCCCPLETAVGSCGLIPVRPFREVPHAWDAHKRIEVAIVHGEHGFSSEGWRAEKTETTQLRPRQRARCFHSFINVFVPDDDIPRGK